MRLLVGQSWWTEVWNFFVYCWTAAVFIFSGDTSVDLNTVQVKSVGYCID